MSRRPNRVSLPPSSFLPHPIAWWWGQDSNLRSASARQIYSLLPLTTRPPHRRERDRRGRRLGEGPACIAPLMTRLRPPDGSPRGDSNPLTYRLQVGCAAVAPLGRFSCRTHYSARQERAPTVLSVDGGLKEVNERSRVRGLGPHPPAPSPVERVRASHELGTLPSIAPPTPSAASARRAYSRGNGS